MGASWSQSESWQEVVTKDQVRDAIRGIETWRKVQEEMKASMPVQRSAPSTGTLLDRVGGSDAVRRIVETYCRKLYADEQLTVFLQSTEMTSLRAKQSNFMCWLFSPSDQPNTSRHMRTAHLRLIKQRGFTPEHFEAGLSYFEAALREHGLSEALVKEVMAKIRPFKDLAFTPLARDAEDEKRWALEEHLKRSPSAATSSRPPSAATSTRPPSAATSTRLPSAATSTRSPMAPSSTPPSPSSTPPPQQQQQQQQPQSPMELDSQKTGRSSPLPPASPSPSAQPLPAQQQSPQQQRQQQWQHPQRLPLPPPSPADTAAAAGETGQQPSIPSSPSTTSATTAATTASDDGGAAVAAAAVRQLVITSSSSETTAGPSRSAHSASYVDSRAAAQRVGAGGGGSPAAAAARGGGIGPSSGPQCPFTGGRLSRPATSASELPTGVADVARAPLRLASSGPTTPPDGRLRGGGGGSGPASVIAAAAAPTPLAPLCLPAPPLPLLLRPLLPPPPPLPSARSSVPSSGTATPTRRSLGQQ